MFVITENIMKRPVFSHYGELAPCIYAPLSLSHNHKNVPCHMSPSSLMYFDVSRNIFITYVKTWIFLLKRGALRKE